VNSATTETTGPATDAMKIAEQKHQPCAEMEPSMPESNVTMETRDQEMVVMKIVRSKFRHNAEMDN